jgi:hypothetical protein
VSENLIQHLNSDGVSKINSFNLADITAGSADTPKKFGFRNIASRVLNSVVAEIANAIFGNDGNDEIRTALDTNGTVGPPVGITATPGGAGAGGVWGATGTYGIVIASLTATGESGPQAEVTFTIDDTTKKVTYAWTQVTGATGYKIYRTATPGTYGASSLRTTIGSGATVSFLDDGSATSAGQPAAANTTGGSGPSYGTPPPDINFDVTDLAVGNMAIGQEFYYWVKRTVPAGTPETGNPRVAFIQAKETA